MGAGEDALVAELVKILANGLWRDPVARGKLLDGHPPELARQRDDLLMSEVDCHRRCSHGVFGPYLQGEAGSHVKQEKSPWLLRN
jgi:hypothetical protein